MKFVTELIKDRLIGMYATGLTAGSLAGVRARARVGLRIEIGSDELDL